MRGNGKNRLGLAGTIGILALLAMALGPTGASAATGGAPTPAGSPPPPGSDSGAPAADPVAGSLALTWARTDPAKSFYFGYRYPRLAFTFSSDRPDNDIRIDVLDGEGEVVKTFYREDAAPEIRYRIRWDGTTNEGRPARNGSYRYRIGPQAPAPASARYARRATTATRLRLGFKMFGFAFPVLGRHDMSGGGGRFGAPRSGHTHQGQDIMANCGVPIVAARGGRVRYSTFQANAGNYVVIDGKGTPNDFMYAHLAQPSSLKPGDVIRTGQPIGVVGRTGDTTACHLHFEMWGPPGWYEGGSPFDPYPLLSRWDRYS